MCVAVAAVKKLPSSDELLDMEKANPDGGGIAWLYGGRVRWRKGISAKEMIAEIDRNEIKPPCLIHFRIATSGGKNKTLCHPFPVSRNASTSLVGNADRVLMHNGHWEGWAKILYDTVPDPTRVSGRWSDTRAMAYIAKAIGDSALDKLGQKILTMDSSGKILQWGGTWLQEDGYNCSNRIWKNKSFQNNVYQFPHDKNYTAFYYPSWSFKDLLSGARKANREKNKDKKKEDAGSNKTGNSSPQRQLIGFQREGLPNGCSIWTGVEG